MVFIAFQANGKNLVTQKNPKTRPITPTMMPTLDISFVSTSPVEAAMAFGGVEMGRSIAREAQTATKIERPCCPPQARNASALSEAR